MKKSNDREVIEKLRSQIAPLKETLKKKRELSVDTTLKKYTSDHPPPSSSSCEFKVRNTLKGHLSKVYAMQWAENQPYIVSASQDGKLLIWDAQTNNKLEAVPLRSSWVMTCAYSPSGRFVAAGGLDNVCTVYQLKLPTLTFNGPGQPYPGNHMEYKHSELVQHTGYLSCCRFLSDTEILTSSGDTSCIRWDIERRKILARFEDHDSDVMSIALSKDKQIFVSGACDATAKIWDIRTPTKCVQTFFGHQADINTVQFFPDDLSIGTGSDDGTCRIFDLRHNGQLAVFANEGIVGGVTSIDFSKSGKLLFAGYDDFNCSVWDTLRGERVQILTGHQNRVSCLGVSNDGFALCTASWDSNLKIWTRIG
jgi:guanine nucleotide-binding protein G(I)/G(S)/G(T) subunit beta-1